MSTRHSHSHIVFSLFLLQDPDVLQPDLRTGSPTSAGILVALSSYSVPHVLADEKSDLELQSISTAA